MTEHEEQPASTELKAAQGVEPEPQEAEKKAEEYLSRLQRLQADFSNFRKRMEQEREEQRRFASEQVILKLLPLLDDLDRALKSVPGGFADSEWFKGIVLIDQKLRGVLKEDGLTRIDAEGKEFDPWEQEAVMAEECEEEQEGKVKCVFRDGYKLHGRVLRPAQVVVFKKK